MFDILAKFTDKSILSLSPLRRQLEHIWNFLRMWTISAHLSIVDLHLYCSDRDVSSLPLYLHKHQKYVDKE